MASWPGEVLCVSYLGSALLLGIGLDRSAVRVHTCILVWHCRYEELVHVPVSDIGVLLI